VFEERFHLVLFQCTFQSACAMLMHFVAFNNSWCRPIFIFSPTETSLYLFYRLGSRYILSICVFRTVKYLREVTPYFRKISASILADVVWNSGLTNDENTETLSKSSERSIPLRLCYVCHGSDTDGTSGGESNPALVVQVHSPDYKSSLILRCPDETTASQWLTSICTVVSSLTPRAIADINSTLLGTALTNGGVSPNNNSPNELNALGELKQIGWLAEQVLVTVRERTCI